MDPEAVVREWGRRRRILERAHRTCGLAVLAVLAGTQALDAYGVVYVPWWARVVAVIALVAIDLIVVKRLCRCPACGQYPGRPTASGRQTGMVPFGWAVCLKCLAALRD